MVERRCFTCCGNGERLLRRQVLAPVDALYTFKEIVIIRAVELTEVQQNSKRKSGPEIDSVEKRVIASKRSAAKSRPYICRTKLF